MLHQNQEESRHIDHFKKLRIRILKVWSALNWTSLDQIWFGSYKSPEDSFLFFFFLDLWGKLVTATETTDYKSSQRRQTDGRTERQTDRRTHRREELKTDRRTLTLLYQKFEGGCRTWGQILPPSFLLLWFLLELQERCVCVCVCVAVWWD